MSDDTLNGNHPHDLDEAAADAIAPPAPGGPSRPDGNELARNAAEPVPTTGRPAPPNDEGDRNPDTAASALTTGRPALRNDDDRNSDAAGPAPTTDRTAASDIGRSTPDDHRPSPVPASAPVDPKAYASARVVVPRVLGLTGARSIVDVGCGTGAWSRACRDLGVPEVVGVDGGEVLDVQRRIPTEFVERDLAEPLDLPRRFNLVICVDVAENLPPDRAGGLVADLTTLAPVVLFSAAVPGQSGTPHVNEQWPEHWVALFDDQGWTCRDAIRPWIRTNDEVTWQYRQTLFIAVSPEADGAYQSLPKLDPAPAANPVDYLRRPVDALPPPPPPRPAARGIPDAAPPAAPPPPAPAVAPPAGATSENERANQTDLPVRPDHGDVTTADDGAHGRRLDRSDDEIEYPKPPGWDALVRLSRRARRRRGDD